MKISMTARNFELGNTLREHVDRRFNRLERYYDRVSRVAVTLTEEKRERRVEARAAIDGDVDVHAEAAAPDFHTAVNKVTDKLARQLKRRGDRRRDHHAPRLGEEIEPAIPEEIVEGGES